MPEHERPDAAPSSAGTSPSDRRAVGREARRRAPRRGLGVVDPALRLRSALETLEAQNDGRLADLVPIRFGRMMASPWTFFRGAAAVMAADLAARPHTGLMVQMCGDAHVLNFGLWATPERNLSFDLRDFDETLPGPFEWDVARLATSLVVLARDNAVDDARAEVAVARCLQSYRTHMATYATARQLDIWYDLIDVTALVSRFSRGRPRTRDEIHRSTGRPPDKPGSRRESSPRRWTVTCGSRRIRHAESISPRTNWQTWSRSWPATARHCRSTDVTSWIDSRSAMRSGRSSASEALACACSSSCSRVGTERIHCSCR